MPEATGTFNIELLYKKDYGRKCGDNLTWEVSGSTLYIDGNGRMYDFDYTDPNGNTESCAPWIQYSDRIDRVVLDDRITYIGKYAFYGLSVLENVRFYPLLNSLEIGDYAFAYCRNLMTLEVPENATLGKYVFYHCESLISFQMPTKMTSVTTGLFSYCYNLRSVYLTDAITKIEAEAFRGCNNLTGINIPSKVKSIGANAFMECRKLTEINYNPLFADFSGVIRATKYSAPTLSGVTHSYTEGRDSVIRADYDSELDRFGLANVFIVICDSPERTATLRAEAVNADPASPYSTVSLGRRVPHIERVDNTPNLAALQDTADRLRSESMQTSERIEITTAPQPDHEANETLLVQVGDLAGVYRETGFEFDLSPGGQMKHRAVRIIV